jgi:hypothetical protein
MSEENVPEGHIEAPICAMDSPSHLKVVFSDEKNKFQYDDSASLIYETATARVFLGDHTSCSMRQLKHRKIRRVIIAESDMHGMAKEEGVMYCKVDPCDSLAPAPCPDEKEEGERIIVPSPLDKAHSFATKAVFEDNQDVLICCKTGLGRAACVAIYFLMRTCDLSLAEAHASLQKARQGGCAETDNKASGFRPSLIHLLLEQEVQMRGSKTIAFDKKTRKLTYLGADAAVAAGGGDAVTDASALPSNSATAASACTPS